MQMTRLAGKKNQKIPLKMLCATNLTWATIMQIVTIVHVSCPTCMTHTACVAQTDEAAGRRSGDDQQ